MIKPTLSGSASPTPANPLHVRDLYTTALNAHRDRVGSQNFTIGRTCIPAQCRRWASLSSPEWVTYQLPFRYATSPLTRESLWRLINSFNGSSTASGKSPHSNLAKLASRAKLGRGAFMNLLLKNTRTATAGWPLVVNLFKGILSYNRWRRQGENSAGMPNWICV